MERAAIDLFLPVMESAVVIASHYAKGAVAIRCSLRTFASGSCLRLAMSWENKLVLFFPKFTRSRSRTRTRRNPTVTRRNPSGRATKGRMRCS